MIITIPVNLDILSKAFRTRWEWNLRASEKRPWCELASPEDEEIRAIFNAAAKVVLGNGEHTMFWSDKWINGQSIKDFAPGIYEFINPEIRAKRTVAQALNSGAWIEDIKKPVTINEFMQVLEISEKCQGVQLNPLTEDKWTWSWESKGMFTTKSVYQAHFKTILFFMLRMPYGILGLQRSANWQCGFLFVREFGRQIVCRLEPHGLDDPWELRESVSSVS